MQYLKALVIGMGILIVLGMALLVYGFTVKSKGKEKTTDSVTIESAVQEFGDINLNLPSACTAESITAEGRRLIIEVGPRTFPKCAKIVILDMTSGKTLGTIALYPQQ